MLASQNFTLRRIWQRSERIVIGTLAFILFLTLWTAANKMAWVNPTFISSPLGVLQASGRVMADSDVLLHFWVSFQEFIVGLAAGTVLGIILGVLLGRYRVVGDIFDPLIMAINSVPRSAFLPIIILWVGIGMGSKMVMVFMGALFPVIVNTMAGVRTTDKTLLDAAMSFGAREYHLLRYVVLPASLPAILTGLRLGYGRALLGVISAEMYTSVKGVGNLIMLYAGAFRIGELLFLVIATSIIGVIGVTAIRKLEERVSLWRQR